MRVLAVGAHFDDVELGCGGTIARHAKEGDDVTIFVATHSGYTNHANIEIRSSQVASQEGQEAAKILGARELICGGFETNNLAANDELVCSILKIIEEKKIECVYTHWSGDVHLDHRALARATITATRHVPRVFMYRANYYDSDGTFNGRFYSDISEYFETKINAIKAHESEFKRTGEKWLQFIKNQNSNDGQKTGTKYAECFEIIKYLH